MNWCVCDGDGNYLTQGLQGPEVCDQAAQVAQSIADRLSESVWLGPDTNVEELDPEYAEAYDLDENRVLEVRPGGKLRRL